eukprot:3242687-Pyramimonas_sp.AAC.1
MPHLPSFLQESGNADQGTQRLASKIQVLRQIYQRYKNLSNAGKAIDWESVVKDVERCQPHVRGEVADMALFVRNYAGGDPPIFLDQLELFSKTLNRYSRDGSGIVFRLLGNLNLEGHPEFVISLLKAALVAPENYCRD